MIDRDKIMEIAKFKGLTPKFAELDYLQDIVLRSIQSEIGNKLIFKGGTCLYKVYGLDRFSEDLDFTARKGFKRKALQKLTYYLTLLDIKNKIEIDTFENAINIYFTIFGPLYDGTKEGLTRLIINISSRERVLLGIKKERYVPLYKELPPFDIYAMEEKELVAEKIRTIYNRNKPRDVYDLWFLLKKRAINFDLELTNKKLSHGKIKFEKSAFMQKVLEKKSNWNRELQTFILTDLPDFDLVKKEIEECV